MAKAMILRMRVVRARCMAGGWGFLYRR